MTKEKKTFRLSSAATEKLRTLAEQERKTETQIVEDLIMQWEGESWSSLSPEAFFRKMEEHFHSWKVGVQLSSRQSERNTVLLLLLMNSLIHNVVSEKEEIYVPTGITKLATARDTHNPQQLEALAKAAGKMYYGAFCEAREFYGTVVKPRDGVGDRQKSTLNNGDE